MSKTQITTAIVATTDKGISLKGNILFSSVSSVLSEGSSLIESHNADSIVIDMSDVEKIDSAGIALLLSWKRLCDTHNKKTLIVDAQKQALSLIATNKLEHLLNLN